MLAKELLKVVEVGGPERDNDALRMLQKEGGDVGQDVEKMDDVWEVAEEVRDREANVVEETARDTARW